MGFLSVLLPWGILLQVLAVLHFIRRRPDTFWLWIIIFFGPAGRASSTSSMEVVPDLGLLRQSFDGFGRRKRISHLEARRPAESGGGQLRGARRSVSG